MKSRMSIFALADMEELHSREICSNRSVKTGEAHRKLTVIVHESPSRLAVREVTDYGTIGLWELW